MTEQQSPFQVSASVGPDADRPLPSFLIVGAMKSGTQTLYDYLCQHPDVRPASVPEVHFFDNNFSRGIDWYRSHFPLVSDDDAGWITGETSPYYLFHPIAPRRAAAVIPAARIVVVLRNPVDRAYSHFHHERVLGRETTRSFEEALDTERERTSADWEALSSGQIETSEAVRRYSYLARGDYAVQLERWLAVFPREQVAAIRAEDLYADPRPVMDRLFDFIGLRPFDGVVDRKLNARTYGDLDARLRSRLNEHFREPVERLARLLGEGPWWDL